MNEQESMMAHEAGLKMAMSGYANVNTNELNSLLEQLTNPEQQIYEIELSLKGQALNSKGEVVQVGKQLLNEEGVAAMIRIVRSMVSRVMYVSNLTEEKISKMTIELGWLISTDLIMQGERYGVKKADRSTIVTIILYPSFESGNSALENGFRRFLKSGIIETTINTQGQPMAKAKGGIGSLLGLGGK